MPQATYLKLAGHVIASFRSCFGWGLHGCACYQTHGSLLHCLSTLTTKVAVYFCCTSLGVTSTGRYPASCPMKPGLSSPAHKRSRDHLFCSCFFIFTYLLSDFKINLYVEAAASDKFAYQRIVMYVLAGHRQEIIEELQQALGLDILRCILWNMKQQRLRINL